MSDQYTRDWHGFGAVVSQLGLSSIALYFTIRALNRVYSNQAKLFGSVEGGGTTFVVATGRLCSNGDVEILQRLEIPTLSPKETVEAITDFFDNHGPILALGIACFGPLDLNSKSDTYGCIMNSPKVRWRGFNLPDALRISLGDSRLPIAIQTDVNACALSEYKIASRDCSMSNYCYITVGTGVGVGIVVNGKPVTGLMHPEGGHVRVPRHHSDICSEFDGICTFHGACVEGLTSAPAIATRLGILQSDLPGLPDDHHVWDTVAYYLAQLCTTLLLTVSPQRISFGGGVMRRKGLIELIRKQTIVLMGGYVDLPQLTPCGVNELITTARFGNDAGAIAAIELGISTFNH